MDERVKKLWIEALRSGEYKQGQMALFKSDRYCCLGVLCDVYRKHVGGKWDDGMFIPAGRGGSAYALPHEVSKWADLSRGRRGDEGELIGMNDEGCDFYQISMCIEQL